MALFIWVLFKQTWNPAKVDKEVENKNLHINGMTPEVILNKKDQ